MNGQINSFSLGPFRLFLLQKILTALECPKHFLKWIQYNAALTMNCVNIGILKIKTKN